MFMKNIKPTNKIFYTTGRLTSEMVIKTEKWEFQFYYRDQDLLHGVLN